MAAALAVGLSACHLPRPAAPAPPEPPAGGAARFSGVELESARQLYVAKCARCHKFYDPAKYPDQEWRGWMDKMSRKARLEPEQKELLVRYLDLYRGGSGSNNPASSLSADYAD
jgi:hypothetical protein